MTTLNKKIGLIQPGTVKAGDLPGHPFRGNQWTDGEGGGTSTVGHSQNMSKLGGAATHRTRSQINRDKEKAAAGPKQLNERELDAFAANGGNMDIHGPSRITHLWKQEGTAGTASEVHTLGNDVVDITVVRGPNVLGEDTYSISYKDVYFGTEKVKWANEDFPASKQGLQDALRYAQDNQDRFADSFKPTRRKKGKRSKGPGISYSIYD